MFNNPETKAHSLLWSSPQLSSSNTASGNYVVEVPANLKKLLFKKGNIKIRNKKANLNPF